MMEVAPISASTPSDLSGAQRTFDANSQSNAVADGNFVDFLSNVMLDANTKVAEADMMVQQFALDDNVPLHQVTIALEEARLSMELMMQVRARMLEGYRDFMNMQI